MTAWIWIPVLLGLAWMLLRRRGLSAEQCSALLAGGAQVVDVRTPGEFRGGHIEGSKNIPLDDLQARSGELDRARAVVLCCASGSRSAMAVALLKRLGFTDVHNAGPWTTLRS
ncbi:MAG: rhodanese-like domain-containing protein [Holophagaceae bacterium]|nr:rhodanese-like domain-containing protein [Holophagaceae bacterium]